jgi:hypothetical protein
MYAWTELYAGLPIVGNDIPAPIRPGDYATDWYDMYPEAYARAADQLAAVGRFDDAILHGEAAANACILYYPITAWLRAKLTLATVYDRAGRKEAACRAYAALDQLLGKNPVSTTRDYAVQRSRELGCALESTVDAH